MPTVHGAIHFNIADGYRFMPDSEIESALLRNTGVMPSRWRCTCDASCISSVFYSRLIDADGCRMFLVCNVSADDGHNWPCLRIEASNLQRVADLLRSPVASAVAYYPMGQPDRDMYVRFLRAGLQEVLESAMTAPPVASA